MTSNTQVFRKKKTFNTSYYRKQTKEENSAHYSVKEYLNRLFQSYDFESTKEYKHPLLMPEHKILNLEDVNHPYSIDVLAYSVYRGEIITAEVNGKYHYKHNQMVKDNYRKNIIADFIKFHFVNTIKWLTVIPNIKKLNETTKTCIDGENSITINTFCIKDPYESQYCHIITHKHVALSKHDIIRKYWNYDSLVEFLRL